jgi:hypothetical protein
MPYLALREVTLNARATDISAYSTTYLPGQLVPESEIDDTMLELLENGDEEVARYLKELDEDSDEYTLVGSMTPEQAAQYALAAEIGALGPQPKEAGETGLTAAPGVLDPADAAAKSQAQAEAGDVVDPLAVDHGEAAEEAPKASKAKKAAKSEAKAEDEA